MRNPSRITFLIIFLAACVVSAAAQNSTEAVAPMQMRGLMPVVEVRLNGQGPFAFMIDTGAGLQADIDTSVAERLGLQANGTAINGDPSGENDREVVTARIDSIQLGTAGREARGVQFRNVTAVVRPQRITKDSSRVDGILGFALINADTPS